jgi:hypothetical protein
MTSRLFAVLLGTGFAVISGTGTGIWPCRSAPVAENLTMIDFVRDLVTFLSQDEPTMQDIVARVGAVRDDPGIPMPIELDFRHPGVRSGSLSLYPDNGMPFVLTIEPEPEARPAVGALISVFGDYRQALTDRGRPIKIVFSPPNEGTCWNVVVIADLPSNASVLETDLVFRIALRRDPN